jgi:hypothetical protein
MHIADFLQVEGWGIFYSTRRSTDGSQGLQNPTRLLKIAPMSAKTCLNNDTINQEGRILSQIRPINDVSVGWKSAGNRPINKMFPECNQKAKVHQNRKTQRT